MSERVVDRATKLIKPVVEELGYVFVDLEYKKDYTGYVLALTIDKDGGVNIDDCEKVSRALDIHLDENDITDGKSYNFNVSSYGLDRQFKTDYDFNKHIGKIIEVKFYAPFNGKKLLIGILNSYNDKNISLEINDEVIEIDRKLIASLCAHIEF